MKISNTRFYLLAVLLQHIFCATAPPQQQAPPQTQAQPREMFAYTVNGPFYSLDPTTNAYVVYTGPYPAEVTLKEFSTGKILYQGQQPAAAPVANTGAPPVANTGAPPVTNTGAPPVTNTGAPPVANTGAPNTGTAADPKAKKDSDKEETPMWKKWWVWVIVIGILLLVIGGIAFFAMKKD